MFYTVDTSKSFEQAISDLKKNLADIKFGVLWELDVPDKLKEKGAQFDTPFRILEVCNPHHAKQALETNIMVGYFLPCKIVVYRQGERTMIGTVKPSMMINMLDDQNLKEFAEQVESQLVKAIDATR